MGKIPQLRFQQFTSDWTLQDWAETVDISTKMVDPKTGEYDHLPHVGPGNIESFTGKVSDVLLVGQSNLISGKFLFKEGDIVYGKINPHLAKYTRAKSAGLTSADAYVLNAKQNLSQDFLYTVLQTLSFYKYSVSVSARTGMPKINRDELNSYSYYAPCREEQQKIAAFLTAVDTKIEQLTQKEALLKQYKKGVMQKIFSQEIRFKADDGSEFPEWEEGYLGDYGALINGLTYSPDDLVEGNGLLVLRSSNIQNDEVSYEDNVYVSLSVGEEALTREGDILICVRNGSKNLIGKNTIIPKGLPKATHGAFMTVFRGESNPFISHWFKTPFFYKQVHINLGATINSINGSDLKKFKVKFPSEKEQKKVADFLFEIDKKIKSVSEKLRMNKSFKKGLLQQMFV